jgi:cell shape-determining protein MreC
MPTPNNPATFIDGGLENIKIYFELNRQLEEFDRAGMLQLDDMLVNLKTRELGQEPNTRFPSLCFSLEDEDVANILNQFQVVIN